MPGAGRVGGQPAGPGRKTGRRKFHEACNSRREKASKFTVSAKPWSSPKVWAMHESSRAAADIAIDTKPDPCSARMRGINWWPCKLGASPRRCTVRRALLPLLQRPLAAGGQSRRSGLLPVRPRAADGRRARRASKCQARIGAVRPRLAGAAALPSPLRVDVPCSASQVA